MKGHPLQRAESLCLLHRAPLVNARLRLPPDKPLISASRRKGSRHPAHTAGKAIVPDFFWRSQYCIVYGDDVWALPVEQGALKAGNIPETNRQQQDVTQYHLFGPQFMAEEQNAVRDT
jgi:hypothetical protein